MKTRKKKKALSRLRKAKLVLRKLNASLHAFDDLTKAQFHNQLKRARNKIKAHRASRKAHRSS